MSEFSRTPQVENLFEGTSDKLVEVVLRTKDDFEGHYNRNSENKLSVENVKQTLSTENRICFFQKQNPDSKDNRPRHKIIIPLGNERAIEAIVGLKIDRLDTFTELFSYRILKFKEVSFFNEPTKHTVKRSCTFQFVELEKRGGSNAENFKQLFNAIESCEVPTVDINKIKDREIWKNYVVALKKLVKQKEQVWKIQNIKTPYSEKREGDLERANYIDIYIDEKDLIDNLERDITGLFNPNELEDYGVNEDKAFIEFKNYRELNQEELNQLKELGEELFYELSPKSPTHFISGEITFKYSDNISKEEIYTEINSKLQSDYHLESALSSEGIILLGESDIPHLQKVLDDNYSHLLKIHKDNIVQLKVDFSNENELLEQSRKLKTQIVENGFQNAGVSISKDAKNILVEIPAPIFQDRHGISIFKGAGTPPAKLSLSNLEIEKSIIRFSPNRQISSKPVKGFEFDGKNFQITNPTKEQIANSIPTLEKEFNGVRFRKIPSIYFFKSTQPVSPETLRNFKTKTDLQGKSEFALANSTLKISAENKGDYDTQVKRIRESFPTALIESKSFNPVFQIQFKADLESKRQSIISKIQNEIRKAVGKSIEFDIIKSHTRILISYQFKSDDEREKCKEAVASACSEYSYILNYSFENRLGKSTYELIKNEKLEADDEKQRFRDVFLASFVLLTPEEQKELEKLHQEQGELASYKGGIQIGKLVKKDGNRLKFRINDEFDEMINAPTDERLEFTDIRNGYIKPIFPGDLTNIDRMIRAMEKVVNPGGRSAYFFNKRGFPYSVGYPVNKNLCNFLFDPNEARQSALDIDEEKTKILDNLNEPFLRNNAKQLEAVVKALISKDMALIQGPPGTGKTTVIAEIIWQALLRDPNAKILITSQTNLAVDNALERIKGKKLVRPIRVGNIDKFEDEGKIYSNDRIKDWIHAKKGSNEERINSDNAVCEWIENVKAKCSKDEKYSTAVAKWKSGLEGKDLPVKQVFSDAYYKYVNVFAATCSECGSKTFGETYRETFSQDSEKRGEVEFDIVIMDEASKATPPELVLPLTLGKKVIIIGDHKQLPPMIDEKEFSEALDSVGALNLIDDWAKDDYKISQFEKLFKNAPKNFVASLDTQFRMHEQIMNCISQFYADQEELEQGLICGIKGEMNIPDFQVRASRWHGLKLEPFIEPKHHAIWVDVETPETKVGTSYENTGEIKAIQAVLKALTRADGFQDYANNFKKDEDKEIGIITYYMPQMQNIRNAMYPNFGKSEWKNFEQHKFENEFQIPFRINTVDRFQGMERNIIIISAVRSNKQVKEEQGRKIQVDNNRYPFALGFARELQRINVGFSRAKRLLIVVGNEKHFSHKQEYAAAIQKMHRISATQIQNLISL